MAVPWALLSRLAAAERRQQAERAPDLDEIDRRAQVLALRSGLISAFTRWDRTAQAGPVHDRDGNLADAMAFDVANALARAYPDDPLFARARDRAMAAAGIASPETP